MKSFEQNKIRVHILLATFRIHNKTKKKNVETIPNLYYCTV